MITILIAEFKQETNTFIAGHTTLENFKARNFLVGSEILSYFHGNRNEIGGFISVLTKRDDVRIIPSIAANALPGPIVQRNVYDFVRATLLKILEMPMPWMEFSCPFTAPWWWKALKTRKDLSWKISAFS